MKYSARYEAAKKIAKIIGDEVSARHFDTLEVNYKDVNGVDPVTNLDKFAQKGIIEFLEKNFEEDVFFAEEDSENQTSLSSDNLWIIDPIDGTANFMHGLPLWGVSIAFASKGEIIFGIVYCPELSFMYDAYTGCDAFLNGKRINVSKVDDLKQSVVTSGLTHGLHIENGRENGIQMFITLLKKTQRVRILGSSVLQICEVASGHTEAFCGTKLKPWDFAASAVILREAGGKITGFSGNAITLESQDFICSNNIIHDELIKICKDTGNFLINRQ